MRRLSISAAILLLALTSPLLCGEPADPVYELRVYTCLPGRLPALHARFRDHTLRLFEKHGIRNIAYWTPASGETADTTLIYLLEHPSREAAKTSWAAFIADPEWKAVAQASERDGKILAQRPESTYLRKTDFSPDVALPQAGGHFELRTYTAQPGKRDALLTRFRDHTQPLFIKHGMPALGYWIPDASEPADKLIYILCHEDAEKAAAHWADFRGDPDWAAAKAASEANGPLVVPPVESVMLRLTDYSPRR